MPSEKSKDYNIMGAMRKRGLRIRHEKIKAAYFKELLPVSEIARRFDIHPSSVRRIVKG